MFFVFYFIFLYYSPNSACARGSGGVVCFDCPCAPPAVANFCLPSGPRGPPQLFLMKSNSDFFFGELVCGCELLSPIWAPVVFLEILFSANLSAVANSHIELTKNSHIELVHIIHRIRSQKSHIELTNRTCT